MSGHSKWANIKHRKAKTDAVRGKLFSRLSREIMMAVREGGADPEANSRLRLAMDRARAESMPSSNIHRAITRAAGGEAGSQLEEMVCEGYAPGGVAVLVEAMSDNRNRTLPEIRSLFQKHGGSLGEAGCVAWMFQEKGTIVVSGERVDEGKLTDLAAELGAEDINQQAGKFEVVCAPSSYDGLKKGLLEAGFSIVSAELSKVPTNYLALSHEAAGRVLNLLDALEEQDDVQNVYANLEVLDADSNTSILFNP